MNFCHIKNGFIIIPTLCNRPEEFLELVLVGNCIDSLMNHLLGRKYNMYNNKDITL